MHKWYFESIHSFKPEVGFKTRFSVESNGRIFTHLWNVNEVIQDKLITYSWKYEQYNGDSLVKFELSEENRLTKLRLTHQVLEDFPDGIPEFRRESGLEGWKFFISKSLKEFLEK